MLLNLVWLYPGCLNLYGDQGNILVLQKRCQWRGITCRIDKLGLKDEFEPGQTDLVFMGGGSDNSQRIVYQDFIVVKGPALRCYLREGGVGLFVCGAYQLLGEYYQSWQGERIEGLGAYSFYTKHSGRNQKRCVGDIVVALERPLFNQEYLVGFENHGGRTYFEAGGHLQPLGKVLHGFGNNGEDGCEGLWADNTIGTYSHGPVLPRNPHLADWLIQQALQRKYGGDVILGPLKDDLTYQAAGTVLAKYHLN